MTAPSFLSWLCSKLMGPPVSGTCWRCPFCDSGGPSFSVRPPLPGKPVKFRCFRCGAWGDECDLLKLFRPELNFPGRAAALDPLRAEYEASAPPAPAPAPSPVLSGDGERGGAERGVWLSFDAIARLTEEQADAVGLAVAYQAALDCGGRPPARRPARTPAEAIAARNGKADGRPHRLNGRAYEHG